MLDSVAYELKHYTVEDFEVKAYLVPEFFKNRIVINVSAMLKDALHFYLLLLQLDLKWLQEILHVRIEALVL